MAIQLRRGTYSAFDSTKLVAGELAVVLSGDPAVSDGRTMYIAFASGAIKRVATWEDASQMIAEYLSESLELTITSSNDAISVSSDNGAYSLTHKMPFSAAKDGLDPMATSVGENTSLGNSSLSFGSGFYIPCVSVDKYGHVTEITYRRVSLPTTGIATLLKAGMVLPDGETISIDQNGKIYVTYENATSSTDGLMSSTDKAKLDAIEANANNYSLPTMSDSTKGGAKVGTGLEMSNDALGLKTMSSSAKGGAKLGDGLEVASDTLSVAIMSPTKKGSAKSGDGLNVSSGVLSLGPLTKSLSGTEVETDGCAIHSLSAEGKCEQVVTTGKNLIPQNSSYGTLDGITFSRNADGSIRLYGTATDHVFLDLISKQSAFHLPDGQYTLSLGLQGEYARKIVSVLSLYDASDNYVAQDLMHTYNKEYSTASTSGYTYSYIRCFLIVYSGSTVDTVVYPQLESGSTATTYEPYTGGAPAPSPSYPQEIKCVRGRNLLPSELSIIDAPSNGITWTINNDGSITANGTASSASGDESRFILANQDTPRGLVRGNTYTLSGSSGGVKVRYGGGSVPGGPVNSSTSVTLTIPMSGNWNFALWVDAGTTVSNVIIRPQLEQGSTPTPYVPYGNIGLEVQGRNLLDIYGKSSAGTSKVLNPDGSASFTAGSSAISVQALISGLPSGTYTLKNLCSQRCYFQTSSSDYSRFLSNGETATIEHVAGDYLRVLFENQSANTTVAYKAMLVKGSTIPTVLIPHGLDLDAALDGASGITRNSDGSHSGTSSALSSARTYIPLELVGKKLVVRAVMTPGSLTVSPKVRAVVGGSNIDGNGGTGTYESTVSFTPTSTEDYITFTSSASGNVTVRDMALYVDETYQPYFHEVVPIPIELYSIPSGTHDTLGIDSAGLPVVNRKCGKISLAIADMNNSENYPGWKNKGAKNLFGFSGTGYFTSLDSYLNINGANNTNIVDFNFATGNDILFLSRDVYGSSFTQSYWIANYPNLVVELVSALATPTTETLDYIDLPELPNGATVRILAQIEPNIGVEWAVESMRPLEDAFRNLMKRAKSEHGEIEEAIADLA